MSAQESISQLRFGPYVTPVCVVGAVVECEVRGLVTVVRASDGPIAWPVGERNGREELIVFKGLARAIRVESAEAVAAAWGVSVHTAEQWHAACRRPRLRKKQTASSPPIPWKKDEDELLARTSLAEAARLTGRTLTAVRKRRRILGLPDGRVAAQRAAKFTSLEQRAIAVRRRLRASIEELAKSLKEIDATCHASRSRFAFWLRQGRHTSSPTDQPAGDSVAANLSR